MNRWGWLAPAVLPIHDLWQSFGSHRGTDVLRAFVVFVGCSRGARTSEPTPGAS